MNVVEGSRASPDTRAQVAAQDRRLEEEAAGSAHALLEHRWHWTADEANPERMTVAEYATMVGKERHVITKDVRAYVWLQSPEGRGKTADEARERVGRSVEQDAAISAVAQEWGQSYGWVRRGHSGHKERVRLVRELAHERAQASGTPLGEAAKKAAELLHQAEVARVQEEAARKARHTLRYIEVDGDMMRVCDLLLKIARTAEGVEFSAEERSLLAPRQARMAQLLEQVERVMAGEARAQSDSRGEPQALRMVQGGRR